jgi:hypothetical protein
VLVPIRQREQHVQHRRGERKHAPRVGSNHGHALDL